MIFKILFCLLLTISSYANNSEYETKKFNGVISTTKEINVYGKGYRYINRLFYKEKRAMERECEKQVQLIKLETDPYINIAQDIKDLGIKLGRGRRASILFSCDITLKSLNNGISIIVKTFTYKSDQVNEKDCLKNQLQLKEEHMTNLVFKQLVKPKYCKNEVLSIKYY